MIDFVVLFLLIAIFYKLRINKNSILYFEYDNCLALQGIAAIIVVYHHLSQTISSGVVLPFFIGYGKYAVVIFFIISGYGMAYSSENKQNYFEHFWKKKFIKILVPYIVISFIYLFWFNVLGENISGVRIIDNFIFDGRPVIRNSWYIFALFYEYLFFYLSCKLFKKSNLKKIISISFANIVYILVIIRFLGWTEYWYNTIFSFVLGMGLYYLKPFLMQRLEKKYLLYLFSAIAVSIILNILLSKPISIHWTLRIAMEQISICFVGLVFIIISFKIKFSNIWGKLGGLSLELYIIHLLIYRTLRSNVLNISSDFIYFILALCISILCAFLFRKLEEYKNAKFVYGVIITFCILGITFFNRVTEEKNLSAKSTTVFVNEFSQNYNVEINATEEIEAQIIVTGENIISGVPHGFGTLKTDWIYITDSEKYLTMFGGFNTAKWEFCMDNGEIVVIDHSDLKFNDYTDFYNDNLSKDIVEIPKSAKQVRITYYVNRASLFNSIKRIVKGIRFGSIRGTISDVITQFEYEKDLRETELCVVYGKIPQPCSKTVYNEKVVLSQGKNSIESLEEVISCGSTISVVARQDITIDITQKEIISSDGIYGIRYLQDDNSIVCERVFDSVGMHANFIDGQEFVNSYSNSFDNIYPWSQIKICSIDEEGNIDYDSRTGDIMVEIPMFYTKRYVKDGWDYLLISEDKKEGFVIDPAFKKGNQYVDHIYVGAYLASMDEGQICSKEGTIPLIDLSPKEIFSLVDEKGEGWKELDISTLNCIQKLFLIETGIKNSQSLFTGYTGAAFIWSEESDPKYAQFSKQSTNTIVIQNTEYTQKFSVGDDIAIVTADSLERVAAYHKFTEAYVNDDSYWQRNIVEISENEEYLNITFSGEPLDIIKNRSIITNLPKVNGTTDNINYHTGAKSSNDEKECFKYRNMENIWGSVCVLIGDVTADETKIYLNDEMLEGFSWDGNEIARTVRGISYYNNNEYLLFPNLNNGKDRYSLSFGDRFSYPEFGGKRYLTYGMTWDLNQTAGLFGYRFLPTLDMKKVEDGARLVYVP